MLATAEQGEIDIIFYTANFSSLYFSFLFLSSLPTNTLDLVKVLPDSAIKIYTKNSHFGADRKIATCSQDGVISLMLS